VFICFLVLQIYFNIPNETIFGRDFSAPVLFFLPLRLFVPEGGLVRNLDE